MRIALSVLAYALNVFDLLCTNRLVNKYGIEIEANPIGKWLYKKQWRMIVFKIVLPAITLAFLAVFDSWVAIAGQCVICLAYTGLAIYHIWIISKDI